jgi:hypothetical protein
MCTSKSWKRPHPESDGGRLFPILKIFTPGYPGTVSGLPFLTDSSPLTMTCDATPFGLSLALGPAPTMPGSPALSQDASRGTALWRRQAGYARGKARAIACGRCRRLWHGHPARGPSWHRHPADETWAGSPCHVGKEFTCNCPGGKAAIGNPFLGAGPFLRASEVFGSSRAKEKGTFYFSHCGGGEVECPLFRRHPLPGSGAALRLRRSPGRPLRLRKTQSESVSFPVTACTPPALRC